MPPIAGPSSESFHLQRRRLPFSLSPSSALLLDRLENSPDWMARLIKIAGASKREKKKCLARASCPLMRTWRRLMALTIYCKAGSSDDEWKNCLQVHHPARYGHGPFSVFILKWRKQRQRLRLTGRTHAGLDGLGLLYCAKPVNLSK